MRQETESSRLTAGRAGCAQREGRGRSRTLNASTKSAVKEYGEREREREKEFPRYDNVSKTVRARFAFAPKVRGLSEQEARFNTTHTRHSCGLFTGRELQAKFTIISDPEGVSFLQQASGQNPRLARNLFETPATHSLRTPSS